MLFNVRSYSANTAGSIITGMDPARNPVCNILMIAVNNSLTGSLCKPGSLSDLVPMDSNGVFTSIEVLLSNTMISDFDFSVIRSATPINCEPLKLVSPALVRIALFKRN